MHAFRICFAACLTLTAAGLLRADEPPTDSPLRLNLRSRFEPFKGSGEWQEVSFVKDLKANETAIILCDVWDDHWCKSASKRCGELAEKIAAVVDAARLRGVTIIHAPSDCMDFYKEAPQRQRIQAVKRVEPPKPLNLPDPPLPIDDSDGGCDDVVPAKSFRAWKRQHPAIRIGKDDVISDNGQEVYSFMKERGIKTLLVAGVHTNMCVLNRTFAIKQMTRWGVPCVLLRDLTDAMYNPKKSPFVAHDAGTSLVIRHIETHWCPTVLSKDLLGR